MRTVKISFKVLGLVLTLYLLNFALIINHELGHYFADKFFGIPVKEVSIGRGGEVYSFFLGESRFVFRILPGGGFVSIPSYAEISNFEGIIIYLAGSSFNLFSALALYNLAKLRYPNYSLVREVKKMARLLIKKVFEGRVDGEEVGSFRRLSYFLVNFSLVFLMGQAAINLSPGNFAFTDGAKALTIFSSMLGLSPWVPIILGVVGDILFLAASFILGLFSGLSFLWLIKMGTQPESGQS